MGEAAQVRADAGAERVVRFMPESVLWGFTAGAGVLIAAMQLGVTLTSLGIGALGLAILFLVPPLGREQAVEATLDPFTYKPSAGFGFRQAPRRGA